MTQSPIQDLRDDSLLRAGFVGPLDGALEYIRQTAGWILPLYILATGPLILVAVAEISAIMERDVTASQFYLLLALPALVWRWGICSLIQSRVLADLSGTKPPAIRKRIAFILVIRTALAPLAIWGIFFFVIPSLLAIAAGTLVTPLLLDASNTGWNQVKKLMRYSVVSTRAMRLAALLMVIFLFASSMVYGVLAIMGTFVLPSLLGIADPRIGVILNSGTLNLGLDFFTLLALDLLWCVSGVILFLELDARRTGADLRSRLQAMLEGPR